MEDFYYLGGVGVSIIGKRSCNACPTMPRLFAKNFLTLGSPPGNKKKLSTIVPRKLNFLSSLTQCDYYLKFKVNDTPSAYFFSPLQRSFVQSDIARMDLAGKNASLWKESSALLYLFN